MQENKIQVTIEGLAGLLMNSNQCVDPLHPLTIEKKKISGKRKKTEADYLELKRLEYLGALYHSEGKLIIPSRCLYATLEAGARKSKDGPKVREGVFIDQNGSLDVDKKYNLDKLFEDESTHFTTVVRINRASIMKTRPFIFWTTAPRKSTKRRRTSSLASTGSIFSGARKGTAPRPAS